MSIQLPADPKDHDYEDQIAAALLASGYYLETRLILKKGTEEVLEFDAIATPVNDYENRRVVEVKSGSWGVADLFKLYGQTLYTSHRAAWLIHRQPASATKKGALAEICDGIPVQTLYVNLRDETTRTASDDIPAALEMEERLRELLFLTAWWSRCADRVAQARFKHWAKSDDSGAEIVERAVAYCAQLQDSLFKTSPIRRARAMYDAYKASPQLTSSLISHVVAQSGDDLKAVRATVTNNAERPYLQYIMALEHKARIAIIKNAYDALLAEKAASDDRAPWRGGNWDAVFKAVLPTAFREGMRTLDAHPQAQQAAYFLQVFIEVLGGFYWPADEADLKIVADSTGVPPEAVESMVGLLDAFFPIQAGWVHKDPSGIHFIKGVPAYVRGAGCFAREALHRREWATDNPSSYWTTRWHNALYALLKPTLSG